MVELQPWVWALIGAAVALLLVVAGYAADWGLRKRIRNEVSRRLRERADTLRAQANQGMGLSGYDPGEPGCQDCPDVEDDDE